MLYGDCGIFLVTVTLLLFILSFFNYNDIVFSRFCTIYSSTTSHSSALVHSIFVESFQACNSFLLVIVVICMEIFTVSLNTVKLLP